MTLLSTRKTESWVGKCLANEELTDTTAKNMQDQQQTTVS